MSEFVEMLANDVDILGVHMAWTAVIQYVSRARPLTVGTWVPMSVGWSRRVPLGGCASPSAVSLSVWIAGVPCEIEENEKPERSRSHMGPRVG